MIFNDHIHDAKVVRVVDGDNVVLNVDQDFRTWHESSFRLYGIDAPETSEPGQLGEEARTWLRSRLPIGTKVVIKTFKNPEKYGRWLAVIFHGDVNINDQLVELGFAEPYYGGARG